MHAASSRAMRDAAVEACALLETKDMEKGHFKRERFLDFAAEVIAQFLQPPDAAQDLGCR